MMAVVTGLGQIAVTVDNVDAAERFYEQQLGLRKLYRFGELAFFDLGGVRLLVERSSVKPFVPASSVLYFKVGDIVSAVRELTGRGVPFIDQPHRIAEMADHDLWMAFFKDPAGNTMALMHEAPKGYSPAQ